MVFAAATWVCAWGNKVDNCHKVLIVNSFLFMLQSMSGGSHEIDITPTDHLSPPSTTSRLSDSDTTSECDLDGLTTGRDGASISSMGSSSSPPPEVYTINIQVSILSWPFCLSDWILVWSGGAKSYSVWCSFWFLDVNLM